MNLFTNQLNSLNLGGFRWRGSRWSGSRWRGIRRRGGLELVAPPPSVDRGGGSSTISWPEPEWWL